MEGRVTRMLRRVELFVKTSEGRRWEIGSNLAAGTALAGIPVSTTHTITGAIVGVGSVQRLSAVRWGVATRIVWAWVLTIPASSLLAAGAFWLIHVFKPTA
ncbi:MAG: inorganic phosphate transporter [Isosphaeraceae bacterium]